MTKYRFRCKAERDDYLNGRLALTEIDATPTGRTLPPKLRIDDFTAELLFRRGYSLRLPEWPLSVCPFCDSPVKSRIDPFGLDGPWWERNKPITFKGCSHVTVIHTAYRGGGLIEHPLKDVTVRLGPEMPFVTPCLVDSYGLKPVLSEIPLTNGDSLFLTVYFSVERSDDHGPCSIDHAADHILLHMFRSQGFRDFDLFPWVECGALQWCEAHEGSLRLADATSEKFPYGDMRGFPGTRVLQSRTTTSAMKKATTATSWGVLEPGTNLSPAQKANVSRYQQADGAFPPEIYDLCSDPREVFHLGEEEQVHWHTMPDADGKVIQLWPEST